ncbi:MAG: hypothetical protein LUH07_16055 [Lachnospiraceae bacterium]|nr:hypothetical protein [Lachnospiraceae bacterium]
MQMLFNVLMGLRRQEINAVKYMEKVMPNRKAAADDDISKIEIDVSRFLKENKSAGCDKDKNLLYCLHGFTTSAQSEKLKVVTKIRRKRIFPKTENVARRISGTYANFFTMEFRKLRRAESRFMRDGAACIPIHFVNQDNFRGDFCAV